MKSASRCIFPGVLAASIVALPFIANAQAPRTAALTWARDTGAETCVDEAALSSAVEARLGREVFVSPARAEVVLDGHVARAGNVWRVRIVMTNAGGQALGTREFDEPSSECAEITNSISLVLSVMIDPEAELQIEPSIEAPPEPTVRPPTTDAPAQARPPVPEVRQIPPRATTFALYAGGIASVGALPLTALGVFVRGAIHLDAIPRMELEARLLPTASSDAVGDKSASFARWSAFVSMCPEWLHSMRVSFHTCAGVEVGALSGVALGFNTNVSRLEALASVVLRAAFALRLWSNLAITVSGTLGAPLLHHQFVGRTSEGQSVALWETPAVFGSGELGFGFDFF